MFMKLLYSEWMRVENRGICCHAASRHTPNSDYVTSTRFGFALRSDNVRLLRLITCPTGNLHDQTSNAYFEDCSYDIERVGVSIAIHNAQSDESEFKHAVMSDERDEIRHD